MFCYGSADSCHCDDSSIKPGTDDEDDLFRIFSSRPNGRLWEANRQGVVHRYDINLLCCYHQEGILGT